MKHKLVKMLAVGSLAVSIQTALAAEPPQMANGILVDAAGRTLYTFDNDRDGKSACNGGCAVAWPPATGDRGDAAGQRLLDHRARRRHGPVGVHGHAALPLRRRREAGRRERRRAGRRVARDPERAAAAGEPIRPRDALRLLAGCDRTEG